MVYPHDSCYEPHPEWRLAEHIDGAVQLARSIGQQRLVVEMSRLRRRDRNSIANLADALGQRRETTAAKLKGARPAGAADMVV